MRTVMVLRPGRKVPGGTGYIGGTLPRPAATGPAPRAPANGDAIASPLIQSSAMLPTRPSVSPLASVAGGQSIDRVNQTTPSKSGKPRDSHSPGTSMSFQAVVSSSAAGVRQSGFVAP